MASPFRHPKTGIYWLRKRVPKDLVPVLGKAEVSRSLETRDSAEAKKRLLTVLSELEAQWANLRVGLQSLTHDEVRAFAQHAHEVFKGVFRARPDEQRFWRTDLTALMWRPATVDPKDLLAPDYLGTLDVDDMHLRAQEAWCREKVAALLTARGLSVDDASRAKLERAFASAAQSASLTLAREAAGEWEDEHWTGHSAPGLELERNHDPDRGGPVARKGARRERCCCDQHAWLSLVRRGA
jgi:hypothetical protein